MSVKSKYLKLPKQVLSFLLPFASTHLCETAFNTSNNKKTNIGLDQMSK